MMNSRNASMRFGEKMPDTLYDTRYLICLFATKEPSLQKKLKIELDARKRRYVSAITIYEIYRLSLEAEGRDVARIRRTAIEKDFEIIGVDSAIAAQAAEIKVKQGKDFPLADAIIAATAMHLKIECFTDDEHMKRVIGLKTRWV